MSRARDVADVQDNLGGAIPPFVAGKNKIINGDFGVWQRGTTFSNPASGAYTADRWLNIYDGTVGTKTISQQTFTPGTAPVTGYEGTYFLRYNQSVASTGGSYVDLRQHIEDVRTFANQTVTISFWAKAAAATSLVVIGDQDFGTGGSSRVFNAINSATFSVTTSWQRFSFTSPVASISGKTIGTNSYFSFIFRVYTSSTFTLDVWGVQMEAGSVATPFTTATGTIQGELAACQRYYFQSPQYFSGAGYTYNASNWRASFQYPVTMRTAPSASYVVANLRASAAAADFLATSASAIFTTNTTNFITAGNSGGMTTGQGIIAFDVAGGALIWSAEL